MSKHESIDTSDATSLPGRADAPILSLNEDRLGRERFARALAAEVLTAPAARGCVMGLTGPWGSGKTSVLNMVAEAIGSDAIVVHFNPWMFSGTEALVSAFFTEIGKQLGRKTAKLKGIAGKLATYGQVLSPFAALAGAGGATQGVANVLKEFAGAPSVFEQRQELHTMLGELEKRLVVIVDDVDRLRPSEVRDIVRLVRLVGDFPNTLYLLAFDRGRVEECLGDGDLARGRAYLEKIVQVTHDVPAAREPEVATLFTDGLLSVLDTLPAGPFVREDWQNIFSLVIRPLLVTPRHVQRLLGSVSMTLRMVGDEIALTDLVGIEAVRVLHPALYEATVSVADHLFARGGFAEGGYQRNRSAAESPIAAMHAASPELAEAVCRWLFPAARRHFENMHHGSEWETTWRWQRKIASSAVFRFYLERQLPAGVVPAALVTNAFEHLADRDGLRQIVDQCSSSELMDLLERLTRPIEDLPFDSDDIEADPARTAIPVLMDLLPRLPEEDAVYGRRGTMTLMRVAVRLLRRMPEEQTRTGAFCAAIADVKTMSGRLILLAVAGHRENIGNALIDATVATELEDQLRGDLMALSPEDFASQDRIARLASFVAETDEGKSALHTFAENDRVIFALLADCVGSTRRQTIGAAAVETTAVLPWEQLLEWFGEETFLHRLAEVITAVANGTEISNEEAAALGLAAEYASGSRPLRPWERLERNQPGVETDERDNSADDEQPGCEGAAATITPLHVQPVIASDGV
ncbi:P-loop NTPase fold protein [Actinospica robiniae]|uniref:P-loop NTPase fold protein n=1 Tax=Actinospica robiniae TaxID=304901 RepID=UPI000425ED70|nr:P-loop NTPase fold protein [Actinospica robiniae]